MEGRISGVIGKTIRAYNLFCNVSILHAKDSFSIQIVCKQFSGGRVIFGEDGLVRKEF